VPPLQLEPRERGDGSCGRSARAAASTPIQSTLTSQWWRRSWVRRRSGSRPTFSAYDNW